jgi:hypothetical protein
MNMMHLIDDYIDYYCGTEGVNIFSTQNDE